jgi:hypothetical protein
MFGRVFVDRCVAAADVAARETDAQVLPFVVILTAFLATVMGTGLVDLHLALVFAGHQRLRLTGLRFIGDIPRFDPDARDQYQQ